jgi:hypothetical protein
MPKSFETINRGAPPKFLPANSIKLNTSYYHLQASKVNLQPQQKKKHILSSSDGSFERSKEEGESN